MFLRRVTNFYISSLRQFLTLVWFSSCCLTSFAFSFCLPKTLIFWDSISFSTLNTSEIILILQVCKLYLASSQSGDFLLWSDIDS